MTGKRAVGRRKLTDAEYAELLTFDIKEIPASSYRYTRQWNVGSFNTEGKTYKVSESARTEFLLSARAYEFLCSCPVWIFQRRECKHIKAIKLWLKAKED